MKTLLTANSAPQTVISSLRRITMLEKIPMLTTAIPYAHLLPKPLSAHLAAAHVFSFGKLLDSGTADALSWQRVVDLMTAAQAMNAETGYTLPFPQTIFAQFNTANRMWTVIYLEQTDTDLRGWVFVYLMDERDWRWAGYMSMERHGTVFVPKDNSFEMRTRPSGIPGALVEHAALHIFCGLALLSHQGSIVLLEPAASAPLAGTPKAFERPNPSVSVLRLAPTQIRYTGPSEPTGLTVRPHDRRGHYRKTGNRLIWVRDTKIHGGATSPTAKIVTYGATNETR